MRMVFGQFLAPCRALVAKSGDPMGSARCFLKAPCPKMLSQGFVFGPWKSTKSMQQSIPKSMPKTYRTMIAKSSGNRSKTNKWWTNSLVRDRVVLRKLYYHYSKTILFQFLMFHFLIDPKQWGEKRNQHGFTIGTTSIKIDTQINWTIDAKLAIQKVPSTNRALERQRVAKGTSNIRKLEVSGLEGPLAVRPPKGDPDTPLGRRPGESCFWSV